MKVPLKPKRTDFGFHTGVDYKTVNDGYKKLGGSPFIWRKDEPYAIPSTAICMQCNTEWVNSVCHRSCTNKCKEGT